MCIRDSRKASPAEIDAAIDRLAVDLVSGGTRGRAASVLVLSLIHISEPTRLLSISYAVFCLKKKKTTMIRDRSMPTTAG